MKNVKRYHIILAVLLVEYWITVQPQMALLILFIAFSLWLILAAVIVDDKQSYRNWIMVSVVLGLMLVTNYYIFIK